MGRVKQYEIEWSRRILEEPEVQALYVPNKLKHVVNFADFMAEIDVICAITFDRRLTEARRNIKSACEENGLIDEKGRWKRRPVSADDLPPPNYAMDADRLIKQGYSKREAFARACYELMDRFGVVADAARSPRLSVRRVR